MRRSEREIIRKLPLFNGITDGHFDRLIQDSFLQRFRERTDLIAQGDIPDFLHIAVDGIVELFARYQGRETTIDNVRPVTTFILAAVVRDEVYLKSARTLDPSRILTKSCETVRSGS